MNLGLQIDLHDEVKSMMNSSYLGIFEEYFSATTTIENQVSNLNGKYLF